MRIIVNENTQVCSVTYNNGQRKDLPLDSQLGLLLPREVYNMNPLVDVLYAGQNALVKVRLADYLEKLSPPSSQPGSPQAGMMEMVQEEEEKVQAQEKSPKAKKSNKWRSQ